MNEIIDLLKQLLLVQSQTIEQLQAEHEDLLAKLKNV